MPIFGLELHSGAAIRTYRPPNRSSSKCANARTARSAPKADLASRCHQLKGWILQAQHLLPSYEPGVADRSEHSPAIRPAGRKPNSGDQAAVPRAPAAMNRRASVAPDATE